MTKARTLADFISDGSPLADGTISVSEVSGAAPLANPTFTGTASGTFSGPLTGNVTGDVTGDVTGNVNTTLIASPTLNATVNIKTTDSNGEGIGLGIDADKKVRFYDDQGASTKMYWNASTVTQKFEDNSKLAFGSSEDLKLYHDGTNKLVGDLTQTGAFTTDKYNNAEALPTVRPSLLLDFANSKTLDPRITFTRGSTATYWDGKTTTKAEENLLRYSEDLSDSAWTKQNASITTNSTTAPDGTTTADTLVEHSTTAYHRVYYNTTPLNVSGQITFSIYAKPSGRNWIGLRTFPDYKVAMFNISTGSVGTVDSGITTSITGVGNGWYRCTVTYDYGSSDLTNVMVYLATGDNNESDGEVYTGDNSSGVYLWGAQLEQRSSATAYTPTTSSPIVKYQPTLQTAASGEARFDHDPVTGESKGLLIEEARTNLIKCSSPEDTDTFGGSGWQDYYGFRAYRNTAIAPDGTQTAATIRAIVGGGTTGASMYVSNPISIPSDATYTYSVYLKKGGERPLDLVTVSVFGNGNASASYQLKVDLRDGTVNNLQSGTAVIEDVGNGWYRCSVTQTLSAGGKYPQVGSYGNAPLGSTFLMWGAQLELGAFTTSFIPTAGSTVTRAVEQVTMSNISPQLNGQEGTLYVEATPPDYSTGDQRLVSIGSSHSNVVEMFREHGSTNFFFAIRHAGTTVSQGSTAWAADTTAKAVIGYKSGDTGFAADGTLIMTNTGTFAGVEMNQMLIGRTFQGGASAWSGEIKKIAFYPKRLPNATLQAMTEE